MFVVSGSRGQDSKSVVLKVGSSAPMGALKRPGGLRQKWVVGGYRLILGAVNK